MSYNTQNKTEALVGVVRSPQELLAAMQKKKEEYYNGFPRFAAVIYGKYGVGKTLLSVQTLLGIEDAQGTNRKVLIIETKSGSISLKGWPELEARVERIQFENFTQIIHIANYIANRYEGFENFCGIVVDEWSDAIAVEARRLQDIRVNAGLMQKSEIDSNQNYVGASLTWPTFNLVANMVKDTLTKVMQQNINVILTSHERVIKSGQDIVGIELNIPEAAQQETLGSVHCALRLEKTAKRVGINEPITFERTLKANTQGYEVATTKIPLPDVFPAEHLYHWLVQYLKSPEQSQANVLQQQTEQPTEQTQQQEQPQQTAITTDDVLAQFGVN